MALCEVVGRKAGAFAKGNAIAEMALCAAVSLLPASVVAMLLYAYDVEPGTTVTLWPHTGQPPWTPRLLWEPFSSITNLSYATVGACLLYAHVRSGGVAVPMAAVFVYMVGASSAAFHLQGSSNASWTKYADIVAIYMMMAFMGANGIHHVFRLRHRTTTLVIGLAAAVTTMLIPEGAIDGVHIILSLGLACILCNTVLVFRRVLVRPLAVMIALWPMGLLLVAYTFQRVAHESLERSKGVPYSAVTVTDAPNILELGTMTAAVANISDVPRRCELRMQYDVYHGIWHMLSSCAIAIMVSTLCSRTSVFDGITWRPVAVHAAYSLCLLCLLFLSDARGVLVFCLVSSSASALYACLRECLPSRPVPHPSETHPL